VQVHRTLVIRGDQGLEGPLIPAAASNSSELVPVDVITLIGPG
jgi:hypothetical protein